MSELGQAERPWDAFWMSLFLHILLPLAPLAIELILTGAIAQESLVLVASIYPISIGVSSQRRAQLGFTILPTIIYAAIYGNVMAVGSANFGVLVFAWVVIGAVVLMHTYERYNRHVVERRPFLSF